MARTAFICFVLLSCATRAQAQDGPPLAFKLTAAAYTGLATADVVQTARCIQAKTCVEVNPTAKSYASSPAMLAFLKGSVVTLTISSAWKAHKKHPKLAWAVLIGATAANGLIVANNARELRKVRR